MNRTQKIGSVGTLIVLVVVVVLHNPSDGYNTEYLETKTVGGGWGAASTADCPIKNYWELLNKGGANRQNLTVEENQIIDRNADKCSGYGRGEERTEMTPLPFLGWSSASPIVAWFGLMRHLMIALASILLVCVAWIFVFKD